MEVHSKTGGHKLPSGSTLTHMRNKYLDTILIAFYANTRRIPTHKAMDIYENLFSEEREELVHQFKQYSEGKNIEIPISVISDEFRIPSEVIAKASDGQLMNDLLEYDNEMDITDQVDDIEELNEETYSDKFLSENDDEFGFDGSLGSGISKKISKNPNKTTKKTSSEKVIDNHIPIDDNMDIY